MAFRYAERVPCPALADVIRAYWSILDDSAEPDAVGRNRVLPDNCIDVIFDLSGARAFVVGPMLTAEVFDHSPSARMFGVRFRPGAATLFLDVKASELRGAHVNASDVWPDAPVLADQLRGAGETEACQLLDEYLLRVRCARAPARLAGFATSLIERARGSVTVNALTAALGVGERRLQRAFEDAVGIGPKQVIRVSRFRAAVRHVVRNRAASLSRVAAECGYADQAHFTHDFAAIAGVTPTAFRAERRLVGFLQD
jgi:AraC-like DNA-binding protein